MNKSLLTLTAAAFLLATTMGTAQAQSTDGDDMMQQGQGMMQQGQQGQGMMQQGQRGERMMQRGQRGERMMQRGQRGERMMQRGRDGEKRYGQHRGRYSDMMRRHHGGYGMGHGRGMGGGMGGGMGHGAMMQVVFALMDADGNGTLSLQEVQDAHARIFAHMDADGDGQLTKAEIRAFFHGGEDRRGSNRRDRSEMSDDMDEADGLNLSDEVGDDDDDN